MPHDNYLKFVISSHTRCEGFFLICCSYVNNLKLHDVILTDQRGVVLKITTQYDTEPKVDSNNFHREVAHVWGIRSLPSSSLDLRQLKVRMVVLF